jgi:hypothetical protein
MVANGITHGCVAHSAGWVDVFVVPSPYGVYFINTCCDFILFDYSYACGLSTTHT